MVELLDLAFDVAELLLQYFRLNLQITELVAHSLVLDPQLFSLLLADFDLFLQHDAPFDRDIVL